MSEEIKSSSNNENLIGDNESENLSQVSLEIENQETPPLRALILLRMKRLTMICHW